MTDREGAAVTASETPWTAVERWEVSCSTDVRGYPTFYINGLSGAQKRDVNRLESFRLMIAAAPELYAALVAAKQELWIGARDSWTMADFKNWATVQQIDEALAKVRANPALSAGEKG